MDYLEKSVVGHLRPLETIAALVFFRQPGILEAWKADAAFDNQQPMV